MTETAVPRAPRGLKTAGKRTWAEILTEFEFPGSPEMMMLVEAAARTADVVARLQEVVDNAPSLRCLGSKGQDVPIPELTELRQYRAQFAQLIRQLDLPAPEADGAGQDGDARILPMSRSEAGRKAAAARWGHRHAQ
jgi:soluble cytochrome b562